MKKISCIYCIENIINNKKYIGSTSDYKNRLRVHKCALNLNKHHSIFLQRSYNKYKEENFIFYIIEEVENNLLLDREQYWIDKINPIYNMYPKAISPLGYKHSEEYCNNIRNRMLGKKWSIESKKKMSNTLSLNHWNRNNKYTTEYKEKLSLIHINKYKDGYINPMQNRKHTEESILKIKNSRIKKPIIQYDKNMNFVAEYESTIEASKTTNICYASICSCAGNGRNKTAGNFIWKYKEIYG